MSVVDFKLPDLGEGLEDGEIVSWQVEVGDVVELNQVLCEIETAKAVVEVPSPFAGRIVERNGDVGATLAVGELLVRIDRDADGAATQSEPPTSAPASTGLDAEEVPTLVGYGERDSTKGRRRRRGNAGAPGNGESATTSVQVRTKPPVRRLARDLGVELTAIAPGTGPGGVITRDDVLAAASGSAAAPAAAPPVPPTGSSAAPDGSGFRGRRPGEIEEVHGIRRRIIEKMEQSRREIPEATCSRTADLTTLWDVRIATNAQAEEAGLGIRVTPLAYILRATVIALRRFPTLNASIDRDAGRITLHEHINLGFAVDTDRGLIVPNIKSAERLGVLELAEQISGLSQAARDGSIGPAELTGGTFTVSNYGAFGNDDGNPIINHPEAGILGVGAIRPRPWVVDGDVVVRRTCTFTLAFDHRVSDGGEAGRFVTYVADLCETPGLVLLDPSD
ncbi:MAG: dihydrolipoamide acetyltransferase family protein [Nitriliruptorales bacterium]|nr:dihydrolipoamide acetyltransferase family protein [Nitriliruptorales bacterium]